MNINNIKSQKSAWGAITIILTLWMALITNFSGKFSREDGNFAFIDPFHQGEYFAVGQSILSSNLLSPPLTIHGALDFVPSMITAHIFGDDRNFLATYGLYAFLGTLSVMLLWAINKSLSTANRQLPVVMALSLMGVSTVGYRDLLLLLSILMFHVLRTCTLSRNERVLMNLVFGITVALGLHWCFDRGITAAVSLGVALLVLVTRDKYNLISLASFSSTMLLLSGVHEIFSLNSLVENVLVLTQTSEQWRYELSSSTLTLIMFACLTNLLALTAYWHSHIASSTINQEVGEAIALTLMTVLLLKIGTNRADIQHINWALWVPGLLALRINQSNFTCRRLFAWLAWALLGLGLMVSVKFKSYAPALIAAALLHEFAAPKATWLQRHASSALRSVMIVSLAALIAVSFKRINNFDYAWLRALPSEQTNWKTVQPAIKWVASELIRTHSQCVFDLTNNGVINGLTKLPACSRFTYPVYATVAYEGELIKSLINANPPIIVYSSTFWSYKIDGRSMKDRFTKLDKLILEKYLVENCYEGYCLRYHVGI